MQLALRRTPPTNATLWQRFACWVIKTRLVSQYCHGGIVIDGHLYHATAKRGLHTLKPNEWSPQNWDIFEVCGDSDLALYNFKEHEGASYDWVSLLTFIGLSVRDTSRFYCYEWCYFAKTGKIAKNKITPEVLLAGGCAYVNGAK